MTISTKKIIAAIDQLKSNFTIDDLNKKVVKISDEINTTHKKNKKKKKSSGGSPKDIIKIHKIL
jgi:hypothetical protein